MESEWNLGGGRQKTSANSRAKVSALPPNSNSDLPVHLLMACPHRQNGYESSRNSNQSIEQKVKGQFDPQCLARGHLH